MQKRKTWILLAAAGLILVAIGTSSLVDPLNAYIKLVKYSGLGLLLNGGLLLAVSVLHTQCEKEKKWLFFESIADFGFGMILLFNPLFTFIAFPLFIGCWILVVGLLKIAAAISLRNLVTGWLFVLCTGILASTFGWLIVYYPNAHASDTTTLIGLFGLLMGVLTLYDAYRFRKTDDTLDLLF